MRKYDNNLPYQWIGRMRSFLLSCSILYLVVRTARKNSSYGVEAFSVPSLLPSSKRRRSGGLDLDLVFLIDIGPARIPKDLGGIRECRRTALGEPHTPNTVPKKDFLNATALTRTREKRGGQLSSSSLSSSTQIITCILVRDKLFRRILGTADVQVNKNSGKARVTNVYIRKEARGKGLGKKIMMGVEDAVRSGTRWSSSETEGKRTLLSLDVETQNSAALSLYRKCGYVSPGVHSVVLLFGKYTGVNLIVTMEKSLSEKRNDKTET